MDTSVDISAVIPCLNERENVVALSDAVISQFVAAGFDHYELVFIDNGSSDGTIELIKSLCSANKRIKLIVNNKNYGQMRSPIHALYQTSGKVIVGISSDFQDPPELIGAFLDRWRNGAYIVLGVRRTENSSLFLRTLRAVGYAFFQRFGDYSVIPGATGFGLYDRAVVDCIRQWRDPEPFFRGMLVESGFPLEVIPYDRPGRAGGRSKNNFFTLFSFALSGLASSSKGLLRFPLIIAGGLLLTSVVTAILVFGAIVFSKFAWWEVGLEVLEILFCLLFFSVGIMAEQVRLISMTVRNSPLVVERERINF